MLDFCDNPVLMLVPDAPANMFRSILEELFKKQKKKKKTHSHEGNTILPFSKYIPGFVDLLAFHPHLPFGPAVLLEQAGFIGIVRLNTATATCKGRTSSTILYTSPQLLVNNVYNSTSDRTRQFPGTASL